MLEISGLTKYYGDKAAIEDISFQVSQGEVVGFLGANGAGKSTTMNIITGYLSATKGTVKVDGFDILFEPAKAKARMGYLPEIPPLYQDLSVWESLCFTYDLKKAKQDRKKYLENLCEMVCIGGVKDRLIRNLSKGYRQRVGIACALVGEPPILILDEPTVGLDPKQIIEIRTLIKELAKTRTVILSSHILQEIEAVCGRVVIIHNGHIVADDTPEALAARQMGGGHLSLQVKGEPDKVCSLLKEISGVQHVEAEKKCGENIWRYLLNTGGEDIREALFYVLSDHKLPILELQDRRATLEDVFLSVTRETGIGDTLETETEGGNPDGSNL